MLIDYNTRIFGLDILRALAISLVVLSHLFWITSKSTGVISEIMSLAGVIGVEIFFVLSGFLIGRIMYGFFVKQAFSFKDVINFWKRRWFRTLPNYYLILIVNVSITLFIGIELPSSLWRYFFFLQ
ncbi:MAG: acyltransferase family protein, partial [Bacteroidota bacterium]